MTSVLQISYSDSNGGAYRATYRLHRALLDAGIESRMLTRTASLGDWTVSGLHGSKAVLTDHLRRGVGRALGRLQPSPQPGVRSVAALPSQWPQRINSLDADLVHLHWINNEMLSIGDIARIRKPLAWTLHDMWAFCGAEHYTDDTRWKSGYCAHNRSNRAGGLDIDRWVWTRKCRSWQRPIDIITPSRWLADCVRDSRLMRDWPTTVIPNAIDTGSWAPVDKRLARGLLQLPVDVPLVAFGALGGAADPRKGFDLLQAALPLLRRTLPELQLVVFGQMTPRQPPDMGFPTHYSGHLHDDLSLRLLYSAVDAFVIPSRQDNLPNTGLEALACATPVVAFDTGGLPDIVQHQYNGFLAEAFLPESLAAGLEWVLTDQQRHGCLCQQARDSAVQRFSPALVARLHQEAYRLAIARQA